MALEFTTNLISSKSQPPIILTGEEKKNLIGGKEYTLLKISNDSGSDNIRDSKKSKTKDKLEVFSDKEFQNLHSKFNEHKIDKSELKRLKEHTVNLINKKNAKYNRIENRLSRVTLRIIAFVSSFFIASAGVLHDKLQKKDQDFHRKINELKNLSNSFDRGIKNLEKIEKVIDGIPNILSDIKEMVSVEDSRKLLQNRLIKDYPTDVNAPYVDQFKKDIDRGDTFKRVDSLSSINDKEPQPPTTIPQGEKTERGVALFKELIQTEEDAQWIVPLQLLANQSTINNLFDAPIMMFNMAAADSQWNDPITDENLVLEAGFSGHNPPINLEIIRDTDSQKIKEVKVHLTGSLDIKERSTGGEEVGRVVKKDAIVGELTYSVTLNDQGQPIVGDLESHLSYSQS